VAGDRPPPEGRGGRRGLIVPRPDRRPVTTSNAGSREIHAGRGGVSVLLVCVFDVNETLLDLAALSASARRCGDLVHDVRGASL